jgi:hypothetical protein
MADESSQKSTIQKLANQGLANRESAPQNAAPQDSPTEIAKPIIAQCRREIAAAWTQVEAARTELKRTRVLHERWSELMKAAAADAAAAAATASEELSHDRPRSEGFVMVPAAKRSRNRRQSAS